MSDTIESALLGRLYEAVGAPEGWPDFLASLGTRLGANMVGFGIFVPTEGQTVIDAAVDAMQGRGASLGMAWGMSLEASKEYVEDWVAPGRDGVKAAALARLARRRRLVFDRRELVDDRRFRRSEFYADFTRRQDYFHSCSAMASGAGNATLMLSVNRSERCGAFVDSALRLLDVLSPHLGRAAALHARCAALQRENQGLRDTIERMSGLMALRRDGHVMWSNALADALVAESRHLAVQRQRLVMREPLANETLHQAIHETASPALAARHGTPRRLRVAGAGQRALTLQVLPAAGFDNAAAAIVELRSDAAAAADPAPGGHFRLTPAEHRVAWLIAQGHSVKAAAEQCGVSVGTLRNQLKQVFHKLDVHRQADLVRLLLCGQLGAPR